MDRLPNELLAYIFSIIIDDPTEHPLFAIALSHVAPRWRKLALGTGDLWARINVTFPLSDTHLEQTKTYLSRSGTYPLAVLVDVRDREWDWSEDTHRATWQVMVPFVRLLVTHVHRWRKFEMLSDTWVPIFTLLFYTKTVTAAPLLETLSLSRCNAYLANRGQIFQPAVLRDPIPLLGGRGSTTGNLRSVTLVGVHAVWTETVLRNLTRLELKYHSSDVMPSAEEFGPILVGCPQLADLAIVGWGPVLQPTVQYREGTFNVPSLRTFTLGFVDAEYVMKLLPMFHTPALRKFILEDVNQLISTAGAQNADALLEWLATRCGSTSMAPSIPVPLRRLRIVELHNIHAQQGAFSQFYAQLMSTEQLTCVDMPNSALLSLTPAMHDNCSPARVRELFCQDMDVETLVQLVLARRNHRSLEPLQRVTMAFLRHQAPLEGMRARLASIGIEVVRGE